MEKTVAELARIAGGEVFGDGALVIRRAASAAGGGPDAVTFAASEGALETALAGECAAVVVKEKVKTEKALIRADEPRRAFARIARTLHPEERPAPGIHPTAFVAPSARLGEYVSVGPFAVIEEEAEIGDRTVIGPGAVVSKGAAVGPDGRLHARVVLYPGVTLGARVIVHAGSVIGADGFGYVTGPAGIEKFPQLGTVVVEDDVEIGANTTIDRAALEETRIGAGTKLDNLVQIAHNVVVGSHAVISAQTGVAGTSRIGSGAVLGGQVGVGDHVTIEDGAIVGAKSGIPTGKLIRKGVYWGSPARPLSEVKRRFAAVGLIERLRRRVAKLEERVAGEES